MRTWLTRLSLAAGIAFTATAEYHLARTLGAAPFIAVMLPVAIDAYVVAALRWFRALDVCLSLALMSAAQVAAHALEAGVIAVSFDLVVVVSLLVPVALWRTHALARSEHDVPAEVPPVAVERAPVPEAYPELPAPVLAAEYAPTRAEVRAEYVPEDDEQPDPDPLIEKARGDFAEQLAQGRTPSIRQLRDTYSIGQPRAQRIRDHLAGAA
jgi:hypothetical protein